MQNAAYTWYLLCYLHSILNSGCKKMSIWIQIKSDAHHFPSPDPQIIPHFPRKTREGGKATITACRIKTQFTHCSWYYHHKQADFSLIRRKREEDDKLTTSLALQEQGTYSFMSRQKILFWTRGFLPPLNYLFWFSTPLLPIPLKNAELHSAKLPHQIFFTGKSLALLPLS